MFGPTNRIGSIFINFFGVPKINQRYSSFLIYHEVRSLDVSINETMAMHLSQNESNLADYNQSEFRAKISHHF